MSSAEEPVYLQDLPNDRPKTTIYEIARAKSSANTKRLGLRDSLTSPEQKRHLPLDRSSSYPPPDDRNIYFISSEAGKDQNILASQSINTSEKVLDPKFRKEKNTEKSLDTQEKHVETCPSQSLSSCLVDAKKADMSLSDSPPSSTEEGKDGSENPDKKSFISMRDIMVRSMFSPRRFSLARKMEAERMSSATSREKAEEEEEMDEEGRTTSGKGRQVEGNTQISYLTVPSTESSRRPSTADVVIEKLQVERVEGGGLTISGLSFGANCHFSLIIFGVFFFFAGVVLSYVGYAFSGEDQNDNHTLVQAAGTSKGALKKPETQKQMKIVGPVFVVGGLLMFFLGIILFAISYKVNKDEKERRLLMSTMQLCQLENSFNQARIETNRSPVHTISVPSQCQYPVLSLRRGSWWMEPTPVELSALATEGISGGDFPPSYNRRGSISSSPLLESGIVWPQPPSPPERVPMQQSLQQQQHQQLQQHEPLQRPLSNISGSVGSSFYGEKDGKFDIATFPSDNYNLHSSYPLQVQSKPVTPRESHVVDQTSGVYHGEVATENYRESRPKSIHSTDEKPYVGLSVPPSSSVPQIQVTSASPGIKARNANNLPTDMAITPVSSNFPLSRNGVAIPRLSRHSVVSKQDS